MIGRFAKGCVLDRGQHKRTSFGVAKMRGLAASSVPASFDLSEFAPPVVDQSRYSACEGCSTSTAIYTTLAKAGTPLSWVPSQAGIYGLARAIDRGDPSYPLTDTGTQTNAVERAIGEFGIRPMGVVQGSTNCDLSDANINAEPLLADLEQDAATLLVGVYQITSTGAERLNDVKLALASGFAVRVDAQVDRAFEDWTPSQAPIGAPDFANALGGHALVALGYHGDVTRIRNSWGGWGASGDCFVSPAWLDAADVFVWSVRRAS